MRFPGLLICCLLLAAPLLHFVPLLAAHSATAVISQYLGYASLIAMAQIMVLATRWPGIELLFGGLDRVYVLHKWLGITAVAGALLHEAISPELKGLEVRTALSGLAEDVGEWGYNALLALVAVTLTTLIPYHWWRISHKFMGAVFALCAFHAYFIEKSFANASPLGLYILALSAVGLVAYVYTLVPARWMRRMHRYTVRTVEASGTATSVTLMPEGRGIAHKAGQFAFLQLPEGAHQEIHPFTISKAPEAGRALRFTIKPLGQGTAALTAALQPGQSVDVSQPFGHFRFAKPDKTQVWIAGGIGITPFLAWAGVLAETHAPIHLFICCGTREEVAHLDELERRAASDANFHVHLCEARKGRRLDVDLTGSHVPDLRTAVVSFCGSEGLRETLRKQLMAAGLRRANFRYEAFKIRSGLPLTFLWRYLLSRLERHAPKTASALRLLPMGAMTPH